MKSLRKKNQMKTGHVKACPPFLLSITVSHSHLSTKAAMVSLTPPTSPQAQAS